MRFFSQTSGQNVFFLASINCGEYHVEGGFSEWHYSSDGHIREVVAKAAEVLGVPFRELERLVECYVGNPNQYHFSQLTPAQERSAESLAQLITFVRKHENSDRLIPETMATNIVDLNTGESITVVAYF